MKTKIKTLLTALAISSVSMAQIIHIPADYPTIQQGIDNSNDGDTLLVADSVYYENIRFNGKAITVASHFIIDGDTNHINNTIIDGSQPANPDIGSVVTFSSGEDSTSVICGFTITGGTGTIVANERYGGGIYCNYSGAKIIHNKIINNIINHSGYTRGGGIGCRYGSSWIVIRDNTIRDNVASSSDNDALGGGIYSRNNYQIIANNEISHDSLSGYNTFGGAVCISNTFETEMTGNIISRNKLNNINWSTAGVYFFTPTGPVSIIQNEFSYNEAAQGTNQGGGGGLRIDHGGDIPVMIDGNRFLHNREDYGGGFLGQYSYNLKLTNNVFIGNNAIDGGAIRIRHNESSDTFRPQIINNTFFNNSASTYGGAVSYYVDPGSGGYSPVIINCIFWENSAPAGGEDIDNWSSDSIFVYYCELDGSNIFGPWSGGFNFKADPEFEGDSIHLIESSPCINTGIDTLEINGTTFYCPDHDIDRDIRPLNGLVDIGADEKYIINPGIEENENDKIICMLYPNPATDYISIELNPEVEIASFDIIDIHGKALLHQENTNNKLSVNVSNYSEGLYFIRFYTSKGIEVKKLVIH